MSANRAVPRVAVITGASSGIGLSAAKQLAAQGWRVIGTGRDVQRIESAQAAIRSCASAPVDMLQVDLSLVAEAVRAADAIAKLTDRIDVLINNAGGTGRERLMTAEGNEAMFVGNHLGHFALTRRLLPLLRKAAAASPAGATRILNVSSKGHEAAPGLDWNDLQMIQSFKAMPAYCNVKLANVLFTRELAVRLQGEGIVAHAMHPGVVSSNFASYGDAGLQRYMSERKDAVTPDQAAEPLVWLATAPEAGRSTGEYYEQRRVVPTSQAAADVEAARRLWVESEKLETRSLGRH